jgi:AsmA protein
MGPLTTRRVVLPAGGVAVLLLLAGAALLLSVDVDRYRGRVQALLSDRLGRKVQLGRIALSLFPVGLRVANASIADDPAFESARPFAQVEELYLSPRLLPLVRGRFELNALELRRPAIELIRGADGRWNAATLGSASADGRESALVLDRLVVSGGLVAITDRQSRSKDGASGVDPRARAVYRNIDLRIDGYAPRAPFDLLLAATLPGAGAQRVSLRGTAGPLAADAIGRTRFDGEARVDEASIGGLLAFLDVAALDGTDGILSGSAEIHHRDGQLSSKGSVQLNAARVRGVELGYPVSAAFDVGHDSTVARLTITQASLRLNQTPLEVAGSIGFAQETPALDLRVTASNASLSEAGRLASAFGVAFGSRTQVQGTVNADVRVSGPADQPALQGQLRLRGVSISGVDIPRPVRADAVDLALTQDEIRSNEFTATTNGTSLSLRAGLRGYTTASPAVDGSVRTAGADLGEVLSIARAWGVQAADGMSGTGRLTLDLRVSGPTSALQYSGSGSLTGAAVATPSMAEPLRVRQAGLTFSMDAASIDDLAFSLGKTTAEGRVTVRNFAAPKVQFELSADRIDVAEMQGLLAPAKKATAAPATGTRTGQSALMSATGSGRIRVGSIVNEALVLENVQAEATLDRGVIRLDPLTASVFGGRHRGSITVDARPTPATFAYASRLEQVDANRLASATTSLRDVIFGALSSDVRVSAVADGAQEVARSMNGTLSLNVADGRIANMDLLHEIANVASFLTGQPPGRKSTGIAALSGTFAVTNGLAQTDDLKATIEGGSLGASGSINLVDQSVNLRLTAVLSKDFSQRVGGTRIGGYMTTALANQQGELVVPMLMTGSMQQPRFAPDARRVAEMKLQNLVPSLRDPRQLTTSILGAIAGAKGEPAAPARQDPVQELRDRLRGLLGAKKEAPKPPTQEETQPAK